MFTRDFLRRISVRLLTSAAMLGPLPALAGSATLTFIDTSGKPLQDVIILVDDGSEPVPKPAEMVQQHRAFQPDILIVNKGSSVNFPNRDNTQHHVFSFSAPKPFNIALYADQPEAPITFEKAGIVDTGSGRRWRASPQGLASEAEGHQRRFEQDTAGPAAHPANPDTGCHARGGARAEWPGRPAKTLS